MYFLARVVGLLSINCIGFEFKKSGVKGRGLYPLLSLVSHSCVSNARYTIACTYIIGRVLIQEERGEGAGSLPTLVSCLTQLCLQCQIYRCMHITGRVQIQDLQGEGAGSLPTLVSCLTQLCLQRQIYRCMYIHYKEVNNSRRAG